MIPIDALIKRFILFVILIGFTLTTAAAMSVPEDYAEIVIGWGIAVFWSMLIILEGGRRLLLWARPDLRLSGALSRSFQVVFVVVLAGFLVQPAATALFPRVSWEGFLGTYMVGVFLGSYVEHVVFVLVFFAVLLVVGFSARVVMSWFLPGDPASRELKIWQTGLFVLVIVLSALALPVRELFGYRTSLSTQWFNPWYVSSYSMHGPVQLLLYALVIGVSTTLTHTWIRRAQQTQALAVFNASALVLSLPFVYGTIRYGVTVEHIQEMGSVYSVCIVCFPLLMFLTALFIVRRGREQPA